MEPIKEFRYEYLFLSNFSRCPVSYKGIVFPTSEHAYQWAKCETDEDRKKILECVTPSQVKALGHKIPCDIKKWDKNKVAVMEEILLQKFSGTLKSRLLETGDAELIEGNYWHDNYWGQCYCAKCKKNVGLNHLGKTLMRVREYLRS
jgi:ribA/ribD-fused uncharacterized protein